MIADAIFKLARGTVPFSGTQGLDRVSMLTDRQN